MPAIPENIKARFAELAVQAESIPLIGDHDAPYTDGSEFHMWATCALNLVLGVFGKAHFQRLDDCVKEASTLSLRLRFLDACRGSFLGAKSDADDNFIPFDADINISH